MRTTLTIDDKLANTLKDAAHRSGRSFKAIVNETLLDGVQFQRARKKPKPYKLNPVALGGVRPGIDLDKALQLADRLEDEELVRKFRMKK